MLQLGSRSKFLGKVCHPSGEPCPADKSGSRGDVLKSSSLQTLCFISELRFGESHRSVLGVQFLKSYQKSGGIP